MNDIASTVDPEPAPVLSGDGHAASAVPPGGPPAAAAAPPGAVAVPPGPPAAVALPAGGPPGNGGGPPPPPDKWYDAMAGVMVAAIGLLVLLGIMIVAMLEIPHDASKGSNVVALATAAFGVIGAIVGAYFGVRAANRAVKQMAERQ
jgi:hypothetical protein